MHCESMISISSSLETTNQITICIIVTRCVIIMFTTVHTSLQEQRTKIRAAKTSLENT